MRNVPNLRVERYRVTHPILGGSTPGENFGYFEVNTPAGTLRIIASDGDPDFPGIGWEHVSVSLHNRTPNWGEMSFVKELFWGDDETVLQLHPKKAEYVNYHPHTLHLWKRIGEDYELPPSILVGPKTEVMP